MGIKKRGIFFSTDTFIALSMILMVILIAYPLIKQNKPRTELQYDILTVFSTLKIGEVNNSFVISLLDEGKISNRNNTILEELGELYVTNITLAKSLAKEMLSDLKITKNIGIWYGDKLIVSINKSSYESAKNIDVARQTITGIQEGLSVTGFSSRAFLLSTKQKKYFYFGGYIGDGNISVLVNFTGNISSAELEIDINKNFTLMINGLTDGNYTVVNSSFRPSNFSIPITHFHSGENIIKIIGDGLFIAGGFLKIAYDTQPTYEQPIRYQFPGIEGIINIYDGFYIPSTISNMSIFLHLISNQTTYLTIGNTTVFNSTVPSESTIDLNDSYLSSILNYQALSYNNIPLRLGLKTIFVNGSVNGTSNADVILITDVSGSMNWRMDSDSIGIDRLCNDSQLYSNSSTNRISVAKCIDKEFISTILGSGAGNRIGLVSFSTSAATYVELTTNQILLNQTIDSYTPLSSTCVSCAINRAYQILQSQSDSSRKKFIIVMTDGVANVRSTPSCRDLYGSEGINLTSSFSSGSYGAIIQRNVDGEWINHSTFTTNQVNALDFSSVNFGFAVAAGGLIRKWDGTGWSSVSSPTSTTLNGISLLNDNFGFGVGASGVVIKWDGLSWASSTSIPNSPTLYDIALVNQTLMFAVGVRNNAGKIYQSINAGTSWTEIFTDSNNLYTIEIINSTFILAFGQNGLNVQWDGTSWSTKAPVTSEDIYSIDSSNETNIYAAGGDSGHSIILKMNQSGWDIVHLRTTDSDSLRAIISLNDSTFAFGRGTTIFEFNGTSFVKTFKVPIGFEGDSTSGISCTSDADSCSETSSFPSLNANYSSCKANKNLNTTVHSVGFGPVTNCNFAANTLMAIASCGNGSYYSSSNAAQLREIYANIAADILKVSYSEQSSQITGNITSILYPDSYIEFNYQKENIPFGLVVTFERQFNDTYTGNFSVPSSSKLLEAKAVSYSSSKWTDNVTINNNKVYSLIDFGTDYTKLGDPFVFTVSPNLTSSSNIIRITTAVGPSNVSQGSSYNKVMFTISKNATAYSSISPIARGCIWTIVQEDNSNITFKVPSSYSGSDECYYTPALQQYDTNDASQGAVNTLLRILDLDLNNKVDILLSQENFQISSTEITGIPYTWSTEVQVRTWD